MILKHFIVSGVFAMMACAASAQSMQVGFGGLKQDPTAPVEVTSETLSVSQSDGKAIFSGDVLVVQGEMRLSAPTVEVVYDTDGAAIARLHARGGVTLVSATDAAEAKSAVYTVATGEVVMTGEVLMTQGPSAISADRMVVDLKTGKARVDGRVKTLINTGKSKP